jgi:integrase/recombinase XerD
MTPLAPTLEAFFTCRLVNEKGVSPHTIAAYRDTFRLLLTFAQQHTGKQPSALQLEDLDAQLISVFLDHLEHQRGNSIRTRNARLAAIHSMFRYAAFRHPEHASLISRVLAVPTKRFERAIVTYLTTEEIDALLAAPDRDRWIGRRDTRCSPSPSRPGCASQSSPVCAAMTCTSAPARTFRSSGKDGNREQPH